MGSTMTHWCPQRPMSVHRANVAYLDPQMPTGVDLCAMPILVSRDSLGSSEANWVNGAPVGSTDRIEIGIGYDCLKCRTKF